MGKYSHLRGKLPAFQQDKTWQEKIDEEKRRILQGAENVEDANVAWLAAKLVEKRRSKQEAEQEVKDLNTVIEALTQLIVARLEANGETGVKLTSGISFYLKDEPYPTVSDRQAVNDWYRNTGQEAMLSINPQTLKGHVKNLLEEGKPLMPGVEVFLRTSLGALGLKGAMDE